MDLQVCNMYNLSLLSLTNCKTYFVIIYHKFGIEKSRNDLLLCL